MMFAVARGSFAFRSPLAGEHVRAFRERGR